MPHPPSKPGKGSGDKRLGPLDFPNCMIINVVGDMSMINIITIEPYVTVGIISMIIQVEQWLLNLYCLGRSKAMLLTCGS